MLQKTHCRAQGPGRNGLQPCQEADECLAFLVPGSTAHGQSRMPLLCRALNPTPQRRACDSHPPNTTAFLCRGFYKFSAYRCCLSSSFPCNTFQGRSLPALPGSGAQGRLCPVTAAAGAGLGLQPTVRGPLCSGGSLRPDQPRRTLLFSSP